MLHETTVKWMAEQGFDPRHIDARGRYEDTALIRASRRGELEIVSDLLAAGARVNLRNMDGTDALWAACVADSFEIADRLLAQGGNLDNQNDNGASVLMFAASSGRSEWVRYLLDRGADPKLRSLDDYSALDLAANVVILRILREIERRDRTAAAES